MVQDTGLVDAADLPLAGKDRVVGAVLIDPGTQAGGAHGQWHQRAGRMASAPSPCCSDSVTHKTNRHRDFHRDQVLLLPSWFCQTAHS
jgi:hypothetical protein